MKSQKVLSPNLLFLPKPFFTRMVLQGLAVVQLQFVFRSVARERFFEPSLLLQSSYSSNRLRILSPATFLWVHHRWRFVISEVDHRVTLTLADDLCGISTSFSEWWQSRKRGDMENIYRPLREIFPYVFTLAGTGEGWRGVAPAAAGSEYCPRSVDVLR